MERRSFIKSAFSVAAGAPLLRNLPFPKGRPFEQQVEPIRLAIYDGFLPRNVQPIEIAGIGTGINQIDEVTNGFFPRQLVVVSSVLDSISLTFLMDVSIHAALSQNKTVDYIASESNAKKTYEERFSYLRPKYRKEIDEELFTPEGNRGRELLRFLDCDLGNPNNRGWKECQQAIRSQPPEILLLDGIDLIEEFLDEKKMAEQLKQLAAELNIPILVLATLEQKTEPGTKEKDLAIRRDLEGLCDVHIALIPEYICDFYSEEDKRSKTYSILKTLVNGFWCPCRKHKGYGAELQLQFVEHFCQFEGRSIPSTFSSLRRE
jgi:hypothetical protein